MMKIIQLDINEAQIDQPGLTESYTDAFWRHAKQLLKGAVVIGTGVLSYGLWRYATQQSVSTVAHRDTTELAPEGYGFSATRDLKNNLDLFTKRRADHCVSNSPLGEFQINSYTSGSQGGVIVAGLSDGGFVAVWTSYGQDGDAYGVYGQLYSPSGLVLGAEFQINNYTTNYQWEPAVTGLSDGGFLVVWRSQGQGGSSSTTGIYGQLYDRFAVRSGNEFRVSDNITSDQRAPEITSLIDGSSMVVWWGYGQTERGIYGQHIAASGAFLGNQSQIKNAASYGTLWPMLTISSLLDGSFVAGWFASTNSGWTVFGQRYTAQEVAFGSELQINKTSYEEYPAIAGLSDGNYVVIWQRQDVSGWGIYGRRFAISGTPLDVEFQINTYTTNDQSYPAISSLTDGSFVAVWQSNGQDGDNYGIYGQRFTIFGTPVGREFQINTNTTNYQGSPAISSLTDGSYVVTWTSTGQDGDSGGVYGQKYLNSTAVDLLNFCDTSYIEDTPVSLQVSLSRLVAGPNQVNISLSFSDVKAGKFNTLIIPPGVITFFNTSVGTWYAYGDTLSGVTTALGNLTFTPFLNYNHNVTVNTHYSDNFGNTLQASFLLVGQAVNDIPVWINNHLPISQGENKILSTMQLLAADVDNTDSELAITASNVQHGQFERTSQPGKPISYFTQKEIKSGFISFHHDDLTFAPSYILNVTDGFLTTSNVWVSVDFNFKPYLLNNALEIQSVGQVVSMTTSMMLATDNDNLPNELVYTIGALQHGHFEVATNAGTPTTQFTQEDINGNLVQFFHDGSHYPPSYTVSVSDGRIATPTSEATISFNIPNKTPYTETTGFKAGVSLGVTGLGALIAYSTWRYRNDQDAKRRRQKSLIGNTVRDELNLSGVNNFESENGVQFIEAISVVIKKLDKNHNVVVIKMTKAEQKAFAQKLAQCLKPYILESAPEEIMEGGNRVSSMYLSLYYQKIKPCRKPEACWLNTDAVKESASKIAEQVNLALHSTDMSKANKNINM